MSEQGNIEAILQGIETDEAKDIARRAAEQFQAVERERSALKLEVLLGRQAVHFIEEVGLLYQHETTARISLVDILFRRKRNIERYQHRKVRGEYSKPYDVPKIGPTAKEYGRSIQRSFAIRKDDEETLMRLDHESLRDPDLPDFLNPAMLPCLEFSSRPITYDERSDRSFASGWMIRDLRCDEINQGNVFGQRLVGGPFHDVDIFWQTKESPDGRIARQHKYHIRMNQRDNSMRDFIALDNSGKQIENMDILGEQHMDSAFEILQQAREEIAADLSFFSR